MGARLDSEPHRYFQRTAQDRFSRRIPELAEGRLPLDRSSERAFLKSLLQALGIPESSQLLVFSNTSLQLSLINPGNPRALYFSDDLYLGYVPGGKIEVATIDAELGAVFYIFDIPRNDSRVVVERARRCMNCHANEDTLKVPGLSVKSVAPGPGGGSLDTFHAGQSGHPVPLSERFGGWYVTGTGGFDQHWGNRMGRLFQGELSATPLEPGTQFSFARYPVDTSDLLAHLLHEHQVGGFNRLIRAQYRFRELRHQNQGALPKVLPRTWRANWPMCWATCSLPKKPLCPDPVCPGIRPSARLLPETGSPLAGIRSKTWTCKPACCASAAAIWSTHPSSMDWIRICAEESCRIWTRLWTRPSSRLRSPTKETRPPATWVTQKPR